MLRKILKYPLKFWRSAIYLVITLYLFTANFSGEGAPSIPHMDKLVHLGIFVCFAFIAMYDLNRGYYKNPFRGWGFVLVILLAYGGGIELFQTWFLPYRSGSWYDMLFDTIGTFFGIYVYYLYKNSRLVKSAAS